MCAVGCLIDDVHYEPKHNLHSVWGAIAELSASLGCDISDPDCAFLSSLQSIHDRHKPSEWRTSLDVFACENNLTVPEQGDA